MYIYIYIYCSLCFNKLIHVAQHTSTSSYVCDTDKVHYTSYVFYSYSNKWLTFCAQMQLAPMSTTTDIKTAVSYGVSTESLLFKIITENNLQRGADLQWLSAFPSEAEVLYPPLTFLQQTGPDRVQVIEVKGHRFKVVEVRPTVA